VVEKLQVESANRVTLSTHVLAISWYWSTDPRTRKSMERSNNELPRILLIIRMVYVCKMVISILPCVAMYNACVQVRESRSSRESPRFSITWICPSPRALSHFSCSPCWMNTTIEMHKHLRRVKSTTESHEYPNSQWTSPGPRIYCAFRQLYALQTTAHEEDARLSHAPLWGHGSNLL